MTHLDCDGIVNLAAPEPVPNRELMKAVRRAEGVTRGLPATRWMLELGAAALRTETEVVLKSRWVVPSRLIAAGFRSRWPRIEEAVADLGRLPGRRAGLQPENFASFK